MQDDYILSREMLRGYLNLKWCSMASRAIRSFPEGLVLLQDSVAPSMRNERDDNIPVGTLFLWSHVSMFQSEMDSINHRKMIQGTISNHQKEIQDSRSVLQKINDHFVKMFPF